MSSVAGSRSTYGTFTIADSDANSGYLVWLALQNQGANVTTGWRIQMINELVGVGGTLIDVHYRENLPANLFLGFRDQFGGDPIVVPPGYRLLAQSLALTASGNTHVYNAIVGRFAAGYSMI